MSRIELRNWARYKGEVAVDLAPEIYAVEAQWEGDADRSNWGGKSKLVEAIPFALFGWHRDARQGAGADDLVITHGEQEGGVVLHLSTGHVVERLRTRGKSGVKLKVHVPGMPQPATGDAAQEAIHELLGLTRDDFFSSLFVRQKQISRFVTGDQGERASLIAEWCQLRPLERAAKRASDALAEAIRKREKAEARAVALGELLGRFLPGTYGLYEASSLEELVGAVAKVRALLEERQGRVSVLRRRKEDLATWDATATVLVERESLEREVEEARREAEEARARVPRMPDLTPLFAAHQAAAADLRTKSALAVGAFDGRCPVGGVACPITEQLNTDRQRSMTARAQAAEAEREAKKALEAGQAEVAAVRAAERMAERAEAVARSLAEQAAKRQEVKLQGPRPESVDPVELSRAEQLVSEARGWLAQAEEAQRQVMTVRRDIDAAQAEAKRLAVEVVELRGAAVVLGRSGAQCVIGQGMVAAVERAANEELSRAGIGLVVRVPWEREGGKLAPECEACGALIKGEAAKACPRCEAPRGKAKVQGPFVSLSDRSGAAEDLVGLTLQLAATSWLRRRRGVQWSSAVLDEPLGALDRANRAAVTAHLVTLLRGRHGFSQAFVISHESGVLDAMPARIIVRASAKGSTLEVM